MKNIYYIKLGIYLAIADLAFIENMWLMTRINVPKQFRNRGHGSALLKLVCDDADTEGVPIQLMVAPSDGLDAKELSEWYYRYDFRYDERGLMVRKPKGD